MKVFGISSLLVAVGFSLDNELLIQSSCSGLSDGDHMLKLMDGDLDESPPVTLRCSNEYAILDVSKDSNLESYFNTFMKFHQYIAGPTNDIHENWEGWYKPDDGETNYVISPDCNTCEFDHKRQLYKSDDESLLKTAYMMTGTMFGCFWNLKGEHNFDEDYDTYQCYYTSGALNTVGEAIRNELNDDSTESDWDNSGVCAVSVRQSNKQLPSPLPVSHDTCTSDLISLGLDSSDTYHLKPSIGTNGDYCVCVKPTNTNYYKVDQSSLNKFYQESLMLSAITEDKTDETEEEEEETVYKLYQKDFESGTYRIKKSGTYTIMEDIIFDFNADYSNPNSDEAWWPHSDQSNEYPGAGDFHDPYFLGFWAGITIEADNVILDLNAFELKQSDTFFWQQRWFTTIGLQGQYFLPGQGIGFFGADPHFAENIIIKNGILGLTSHHNIHGHFNKNILIENLQVKDFETHGIQFNGFDGITIRNVEIGPTSEYKSHFKGEYGHARTLLPRFQQVANEYPDETIKFYGRDEEVTMQDIVDELKKQTDMAYYHIAEGREYDDNDESWKSAKYLFIDDTNLPNGAAMYGIFLNTYGASVLTYNLYTSFYSSDATIENVKIHGLRHSMNEYVRMSYPSSGNLFMNPLHAPFDAFQVLESLTDFDNIRYKGSVLTDACLALEKFSDNWNYKQAQLIMDNKMLTWALGEDLDGMNDVGIGCNIDVMIHSGKGINGLRIDGVDGITISDVEIYDLIEETPMGRMDCGEYEHYEGDCTGICGGHFRQTAPMQIGFSGNMLQGININAAKGLVLNNIYVHDLESHNGQVFGISVWPAVEIKLTGDIRTDTLFAGSQIKRGELTYYSLPNKAPEACGFRFYKEFEKDGFLYSSTMDHNEASVTSSCIGGHVLCMGSQLGTLIGEFDLHDIDSDQCDYQGISGSSVPEKTDDYSDRMMEIPMDSNKGAEMMDKNVGSKIKQNDYSKQHQGKEYYFGKSSSNEEIESSSTKNKKHDNGYTILDYILFIGSCTIAVFLIRYIINNYGLEIEKKLRSLTSNNTNYSLVNTDDEDNRYGAVL